MVFYGETPTGPQARLIRIAIRDKHGLSATARVDISINGRPSGSISTGSGVSESTIEISDPNASVELLVTVADEVQRGSLPPGQDSIRFDFKTAALVKARVPPVASCPDGTTGSPCVICRDGDDTWKICT